MKFYVIITKDKIFIMCLRLGHINDLKNIL